jgi:hypothetical protein
MQVASQKCELRVENASCESESARCESDLRMNFFYVISILRSGSSNHSHSV